MQGVQKSEPHSQTSTSSLRMGKAKIIDGELMRFTPVGFLPRLKRFAAEGQGLFCLKTSCRLVCKLTKRQRSFIRRKHNELAALAIAMLWIG